jgi:hypothetical protein
MFDKKKSNHNHLGVALDDLVVVLLASNIDASMDGNILVAQFEYYKVRVEVTPPDTRESEHGPIKAIVRVISELSKPFSELFVGREVETAARFNLYAALGAIYIHHGKVSIGSRLTIYEAENTWETQHLSLLIFAVLGGTEAILGGIRRAFSEIAPVGGESKWSIKDFQTVHEYLSKICVCNEGEMGLTAEFGLSDGALSWISGHDNTALYEMMADQPHPELGGGLFCLLQMPHQISNPEKLREICAQLNNMEMAGVDLPPHFGAWCEGKVRNPAYVSFLPNALYSVNGIAQIASIWALNRAHWAKSVLSSMGIVPFDQSGESQG